MNINAPIQMTSEQLANVLKLANEAGKRGESVTEATIKEAFVTVSTSKDPVPEPVPETAPSAIPAPSPRRQQQSNNRIRDDAPSVAGTSVKPDHKSDTDDIDEDVGARLCPHCGVVLIRGFQDACDKCRPNITPKAEPIRRPCTRCRSHLVCVPDLLCFDCKERELRRSANDSAIAMRRAQVPPSSPGPTDGSGQV